MYRNFNIVIKTDPSTYYADEAVAVVPSELPHVAEIYYDDGTFMSWVSTPEAKDLEESAMDVIDDCLDGHEEYGEPTIDDAIDQYFADN